MCDCNQLTIPELEMSERLLIISFRLWALPHVQPEYEHPDWRAGLVSAGLEMVTHALFNPLLEVLFSTTRRSITVHRAMCVGISHDERVFLRCISLYQNARRETGREIIEAWLTPEAWRVADILASALADTLQTAGIKLPLRETVKARMADRKPARDSVRPKLRLVH